MSTTAHSSTRDIVEAGYAAIGAGDVEAFAALLADDVTLSEPDNHPAPGTWTSKADLLEAFPGIAGGLGLQGLAVKGLIVDGDQAVGLLEMTCTSKSGAAVTMDIAEVVQVRDGKIVSIRPYYWDTAALLAALEG